MVYTLKENTKSSFLNSGSVEDEGISPKTQKSVNLKDSQWRYIEEQAEELQVSQNEALRRILTTFVEQNPEKQIRKALKR